MRKVATLRAPRARVRALAHTINSSLRRWPGLPGFLQFQGPVQSEQELDHLDRFGEVAEETGIQSFSVSRDIAFALMVINGMCAVAGSAASEQGDARAFFGAGLLVKPALHSAIKRISARPAGAYRRRDGSEGQAPGRCAGL